MNFDSGIETRPLGSFVGRGTLGPTRTEDRRFRNHRKTRQQENRPLVRIRARYLVFYLLILLFCLDLALSGERVTNLSMEMENEDFDMTP